MKRAPLRPAWLLAREFYRLMRAPEPGLARCPVVLALLVAGYIGLLGWKHVP